MAEQTLSTLAINSQYILYTESGVRKDQRIIVLGILGFEEAKRRFALNNVALNYKITPDIESEKPGVDPYELYFRDKMFYHCNKVDMYGRISDNVKDQFVVWKDIINWELTRAIQSTRTFKVVMNLNSSVNTSVINPLTEDDLITHLTETAKSLGSEISFRRIHDDFITPEEIFDNRIEKIEEIMRSLEGLATVAPIIDRLNANDITLAIERINNSLDIVNESLTTIKAGLRV